MHTFRSNLTYIEEFRARGRPCWRWTAWRRRCGFCHGAPEPVVPIKSDEFGVPASGLSHTREPHHLKRINNNGLSQLFQTVTAGALRRRASLCWRVSSQPGRRCALVPGQTDATRKLSLGSPMHVHHLRSSAAAFKSSPTDVSEEADESRQLATARSAVSCGRTDGSVMHCPSPSSG